MIFLKCKIRFIYVGFNCKRKKSGVKKCLEILPLRGGGGGGPLMANAILNFHFDFLNPSLIRYIANMKRRKKIEEDTKEWMILPHSSLLS